MRVRDLTETERNIVCQIAALATLLMSKGVLTREEYIDELNRMEGVIKSWPDSDLVNPGDSV